jgi:transcriptional regulator with AAA-type ATPase domain
MPSHEEEPDKLPRLDIGIASDWLAEDGVLVGTSRIISQTREQVRRVASTNAPVLIVGEPGTGKSEIARAIHDLSDRRDTVNVTVPTATLPRDLAIDQLFGHAKGAFTGADKVGVGAIERAQGGTIVFEDLGEASAEVQSLLAAFSATREFTKLGESRERVANVRIIATVTPKSLQSIRQDLRYRLSVLTIEVPTLRSRPEDISLLAKTILKNQGDHILSDGALSKLQEYSFPGNVGELKSILQRATLMARGDVIDVEDLGLKEPTTPEMADHAALQSELREARIQLEAYQRSAMIANPIWQGRSFTVESDYCFVLMPFSETNDLQSVYQNHVKRVVEEKCGLRCERADDIHDISGIMQSVWESVNRARVIIAEMTDRNPNVFYELGIAHTLGKHVVMITQSMDFVPFDLKHLRCIVYDYKPGQIERFEAHLAKTILTVLSSTQVPSLALIVP